MAFDAKSMSVGESASAGALFKSLNMDEQIILKLVETSADKLTFEAKFCGVVLGEVYLENGVWSQSWQP